MTAPWSGSEEADGEEELAEGVGSADAVAWAVGAAEGAAALGVVAAGLGALLTVACWRDRAVAAAPSEGGNDHEDGQERPDVLPLGRLGAVHADGHILRRRGQIHPWGTENSRVQTIGKEGVGARVARGECGVACAALGWCYE